MTKPDSTLVMESLHESLNAFWTFENGVRVPARYGDVEVEWEALRDGCGLWDASVCDRLELLGPDRHRFLNGMVTADIAGMEVGESCYGLFTNLKGRVLSDATFMALKDRIWVRLPPGLGAEIREHLSRFVISDRVEVLPVLDMVPIVVAGKTAAAVVSRWLGGGEPPAEGFHCRAKLLDTEVCLLAEQRVGTPAFSLWVSASLVEDLVRALLEAAPEVQPVGLEAIERLRVERGIPRFGSEIGPDTFPQEAGVGDAVNYEKGCYLGQEIVARIHYRGGVNRLLVALDPVETGLDGEDSEGHLSEEQHIEASDDDSSAGDQAANELGWMGAATIPEAPVEDTGEDRIGLETEPEEDLVEPSDAHRHAGSGPEKGQAVTFEDREIGRVTSVARGSGAGEWVALAMISTAASAEGTIVRLEAGPEARVVPLPLGDS